MLENSYITHNIGFNSLPSDSHCSVYNALLRNPVKVSYFRNVIYYVNVTFIPIFSPYGQENARNENRECNIKYCIFS
jgi:hypothetical protein